MITLKVKYENFTTFAIVVVIGYVFLVSLIFVIVVISSASVTSPGCLVPCCDSES